MTVGYHHTPTAADAQPGRFCPADYRLGPGAFLASSWRASDCLYVAGGLYGNTVALDSLLRLFDRETAQAQAPALVFNGDFHWFDRDPAEFARIEALTAAHLRLRGNVETELARTPAESEQDVGCGCAYPEEFSQGVVERSNAMHRMQAQLIASSHTCMAVADSRATDEAHASDASWLAIINNGATGLGNFSGSHAGLITRIASSALPLPREAIELYAMERDGLRISALSIDFPLATWLSCFDAQWPAGSDAALSYRERVIHGASWRPADAARGVFRRVDAAADGSIDCMPS